MNISLAPAARSVMPHVMEWWAARRQESWTSEILAVLDIVSLDTIAGKHGISRASLVAIAEQDPSACSEMIRMMRALNIDPMEAAGEPEFPEMAGRCAGCRNKHQCHDHLREGTASAHLDEFCANATELNAMRATPHLLERN